MKKNIDTESKKNKRKHLKVVESHGKSALYPVVISPENSFREKHYLTK